MSIVNNKSTVSEEERTGKVLDSIEVWRVRASLEVLPCVLDHDKVYLSCLVLVQPRNADKMLNETKKSINTNTYNATFLFKSFNDKRCIKLYICNVYHKLHSSQISNRFHYSILILCIFSSNSWL